MTNITDMDTTQSLTLANYTYGYNAGGELASYQDNSGNSLTYGYDTNGELTSASGTLNGSTYGVNYSYDANGNRTMSGYQTGTGNELLSDGTYNYTYDNVGNMTSQTNIATGYVTYYSWDYRNRLTEVKQEDNHGNVLNDEKFTYDVFNNRIAVSINGTPQLYTVYDGINPYMDFNGSGTLTERYLTNPNGLNQFYGQVNASGTTQWFLTDNLGSVRQVVDTSGNVLDGITYDPYGNVLGQTNAANAPRFGFTGAAVGSLTGNNLFWARPYFPADGRFTTPDWLGFAAGNPNLYGYVFNSPLDMTDPTGLYGDNPPVPGGLPPGPYKMLPPGMLGPHGEILPPSRMPNYALDKLFEAFRNSLPPGPDPKTQQLLREFLEKACDYDIPTEEWPGPSGHGGLNDWELWWWIERNGGHWSGRKPPRPYPGPYPRPLPIIRPGQGKG